MSAVRSCHGGRVRVSSRHETARKCPGTRAAPQARRPGRQGRFDHGRGRPRPRRQRPQRPPVGGRPQGQGRRGARCRPAPRRGAPAQPQPAAAGPLLVQAAAGRVRLRHRTVDRPEGRATDPREVRRLVPPPVPQRVAGGSGDHAAEAGGAGPRAGRAEDRRVAVEDLAAPEKTRGRPGPTSSLPTRAARTSPPWCGAAWPRGAARRSTRCREGSGRRSP